MKVKPDLSFWKFLWNISFGFFGVQIAYALQSANISRIFADIRRRPAQFKLFLDIATTGRYLIVQPIVGAASDKTWTRFGTPYSLPVCRFTGSRTGDVPVCRMPGSFRIAVSTAMIFGLVSLMFLDTSINMAMQPFRR